MIEKLDIASVFEYTLQASLNARGFGDAKDCLERVKRKTGISPTRFTAIAIVRLFQDIDKGVVKPEDFQFENYWKKGTDKSQLSVIK